MKCHGLYACSKCFVKFSGEAESTLVQRLVCRAAVGDRGLSTFQERRVATALPRVQGDGRSC